MRDQDGLSGFNNFVNTSFGAGLGGIFQKNFFGEIGLRGVSMSHGHAYDFFVRRKKIDGAPSGQAGHEQAGNLLNGRFVADTVLEKLSRIG
ncbi:hypothetical protein D3C87_1464620 [compost metagenome]